jgi:protein-L-isoaspartate(D-aspartate) O-methyltransferase
MARVEEHRNFFARMITANAGIPPGSALEAAFASIPRERFLPPGPWKVYAPRAGYIETPSDDPAFLYQDVVVSLGTDGPLNNGQPTLHAVSIAALGIEKGNRIVHVGAGSGYYTALLAELTGENGSVEAYEVEPSLAQQAARNLAEYRQVAVHHRSGSEAPLPECDVIYVSAGATEPLSVWLDALRPKGRLLFPLTPAEGVGAMLLVTRRLDGRFDARFVVQAMFVPCAGARDEATAQKLTEAFRGFGWTQVKSLHRGDLPREDSWFSAPGWSLSTRAHDAP